MTAKEQIERVRALLHESLSGLHLSGSTTGAGTVTTFVCNNFADVSDANLGDDALNEMEVVISSGDNAGLRFRIADWVKSTSTATLYESAPFSIVSGVTIEVGQAGFFSDFEILKWLNDAALLIANSLPPSALTDFLKASSVTGTEGDSYGSVTLPADVLKIPVAVTINGRTAKILGSNSISRFLDDAKINDAICLLGGRNAIYKPNGDYTVTFYYVPYPEAFIHSGTCGLPARFHSAMVDYAVAQGWMKKENAGLAQASMNTLLQKLQITDNDLKGVVRQKG